MKRYISLIISLFLFQIIVAQTYTVSGVVSHKGTGEFIKGHTVIVYSPQNDRYYTAETDKYGKYTIEAFFSEISPDSLIVKTYSHCSSQNEMVYSQVIYTDLFLFNVDFEICNTSINCFSDFSCFYDTKRMVHFLSFADEGDTYLWNFGDGVGSTLANPKHSYTENGTYKISLTVKSDGCRKTSFKEIEIIKYSKVAGDIFAGENLSEDGDIFLVYKKDKELTTIEKSERIENGSFAFKKITAEECILFAIPDICSYPYVYPKYLPTYSGSVCSWEDAEKISCDNDIDNFNISLVSYNYPYYGDCAVSGKIFKDERMNFDGFVVFLLNKDREPMDFTLPNPETGQYLFDELPSGRYFVRPERVGFSTKEILVHLSSGNTTPNVSYEISGNSLISKEEEADDEPKFDLSFDLRYKSVYLNIEDKLETNVVCELYDLNGKCVHQSYQEPKNIHLNFNSITSGIYLFRMRTYDNSKVFFKKIFLAN